MPDIGKTFAKSSPDDELVGGQPRWFWGLPRKAREQELMKRAERSGTKYVRDGSRIGLKPDGTPPEKESVPRKPKIDKKDRKAIAKRLKAEGRNT